MNVLKNKMEKMRRNSTHFQYQFFKCSDCGRKLKICQIQKKNDEVCQEFAVFTYYCWKCDMTYFIFRFIVKNEDLNNEYL